MHARGSVWGGCDVPRGGISEWRKDLGEACAAGCADERDAREAVARHLTDGGDPPGTAELSGEESGEAGDGTKWRAALASGGGGGRLGGGAKEGVDVGGGLAVLAEDEGGHAHYQERGGCQ
eukprot:scaffold4663_cov104-Isochrysis_galbana.AAC.4